MSRCGFCHKVINDYLPFTCRFCHDSYCPDHRLPENHKCINFHPKKLVDNLKEYHPKQHTCRNCGRLISSKYNLCHDCWLNINKQEYGKKCKNCGGTIPHYRTYCAACYHRRKREQRQKLIKTVQIIVVMFFLYLGWIYIQSGIYLEDIINVSSVTTKSKPPDINIQQLEYRIHNLMNRQREYYKVRPLEYDTKLAEIARAHSQDMAQNNYFEHTNKLGQGPTERGTIRGYICHKDYGTYFMEGIAENINQDWLYSSIITEQNGVEGPDKTVSWDKGIERYEWNNEESLAVRVVESLMNSPGHRQNILDPAYSKEGIGVAISKNMKVYLTQDFC